MGGHQPVRTASDDQGMDAANPEALLVVSFGGPESVDDVEPFLLRVTGGSGAPAHRVAQVAEHYRELGGVSPLNQANRGLIERLRAQAVARGLGESVYLGNRNCEPFMGDVMARMREDGVRCASVFITSAFSSYSGCRQYRENLYDASAGHGIYLKVLPRFFDHTVLRDIWADRIVESWPTGNPVLVFVTHSLPTAMAKGLGPGGGYLPQHRHLARAVVAACSPRLASPLPFRLAFQSRSGPPDQPWLEPDINEVVAQAADDGHDSCVVAPIGFCAENLEIMWDLDVAAAQTAREHGVDFHRLALPQSDDRFVGMVWDLVRRYPRGHLCDPECCPNPRGARPATGDAKRT